MTPTPQDVLREAARILMRDGWIQGTEGPRTGPNCALGAIARAAGCRPINAGRAEGLLERFIKAPVTRWNDAPERTAEDVILALKRAAEES